MNYLTFDEMTCAICLKINMIILINLCDNHDELICELHSNVTCNYFNENTIRFYNVLRLLKPNVVMWVYACLAKIMSKDYKSLSK